MIIEVWVERGLRHENSVRYTADSSNGTITFIARVQAEKFRMGPMDCVTRIPPTRGDYGMLGKIDERLGLGR